jgi:hypothetical protein
VTGGLERLRNDLAEVYVQANAAGQLRKKDDPRQFK